MATSGSCHGPARRGTRSEIGSSSRSWVPTACVIDASGKGISPDSSEAAGGSEARVVSECEAGPEREGSERGAPEGGAQEGGGAEGGVERGAPAGGGVERGGGGAERGGGGSEGGGRVLTAPGGG